MAKEESQQVAEVLSTAHAGQPAAQELGVAAAEQDTVSDAPRAEDLGASSDTDTVSTTEQQHFEPPSEEELELMELVHHSKEYHGHG